jgi:hypothetical protein
MGLLGTKRGVRNSAARRRTVETERAVSGTSIITLESLESRLQTNLTVSTLLLTIGATLPSLISISGLSELSCYPDKAAAAQAYYKFQVSHGKRSSKLAVG